MARTIDHEHRATLAAAVGERFLAGGTARASLRELAVDVGASARMLVHHFGTREQLADAALEVVRERQLAAARRAIVPRGDALANLQETWAWFSRDDTRRFFVLFTDVAALERSVPAHERQFGGRLESDWLPLFEGVFEADERFAPDAPTLALLVVGVLRGFALGRTEEPRSEQHRAAFETLVELIANGAGRHR